MSDDRCRGACFDELMGVGSRPDLYVTLHQALVPSPPNY